MAVSRAIRRQVLARARQRCEYCQIDGWQLTVDHVTPAVAWRSAMPPEGEQDHPDNLAAACFLCNRAKWKVTSGYDPVTASEQPLFNPRLHRWDEYFEWSADFQQIVGITPIGRATVVGLQMNREIYKQQRRRLRAAMLGGDPDWP
jgi:hypothetical protein